MITQQNTYSTSFLAYSDFLWTVEFGVIFLHDFCIFNHYIVFQAFDFRQTTRFRLKTIINCEKERKSCVTRLDRPLSLN